MKLPLLLPFVILSSTLPPCLASPISTSLSSLSSSNQTPSPPPSLSHSNSTSEDQESGLWSKDFTRRVVLIRHGEKPEDGGVGLSKEGKKRAQCLRKVLGKKGKRDFGLIIAQDYNRDTRSRVRPYLTVKPLADDLGLKVDISCERDDAACVRKVVAKFAKHSNKDVLICWKHSFLHELTHALGADSKKPYPDDRFDLMWTIDHTKKISRESEKCAGLDDDRPQYEAEEEGEEQEEEEESMQWLDQIVLD